MNSRRFAWCVLAILVIGSATRVAWLRSDPPVNEPVGIIWHDEGAWTHNARNKAIDGIWRTDDWNPMFVSPVFTALEYGAFSLLGVGLWQARVVPVASGLLTIAVLMIGLRRLGGRRAAAIGGALVATSYALIMWNRAALLESTMIAFLAASWSAIVFSERRPVWGVVGGVCAALAWFTKASAAFFVAALVIDALCRLANTRRGLTPLARSSEMTAAAWTLAGLFAGGAVLAAVVVVPHWQEYAFYNWQMSVMRKPAYSIGALVDRATWIPLVPSTFSRMWPVVVLACASLVAMATRPRSLRPGERLLLLWMVIGIAELVVHDSGNERRYVMFIPAIAALAALVVTDTRTLVARGLVERTLASRVVVPVLVAVATYVVIGSGLRFFFLDEIHAGTLRFPVRIAAGAAVAAAALFAWKWPAIADLLESAQIPPALLTAATVATVAWNGALYGEWVTVRAERNYQASIAVGHILPAGTVVQGKLANGLALDNGIRPLFVGNGFGNYGNRFDVSSGRYLLTYDRPRIGYESSDGSGLIDRILEHYPRSRTIATFEVDETPDVDRAALIDKQPSP